RVVPASPRILRAGPPPKHKRREGGEGQTRAAASIAKTFDRIRSDERKGAPARPPKNELPYGYDDDASKTREARERSTSLGGECDEGDEDGIGGRGRSGAVARRTQQSSGTAGALPGASAREVRPTTNVRLGACFLRGSGPSPPAASRHRRRLEDVDYWRKRAGWADDDESMKSYNQGVYNSYYAGEGDDWAFEQGGNSGGGSSNGGSGGAVGSGRGGMGSLGWIVGLVSSGIFLLMLFKCCGPAERSGGERGGDKRARKSLSSSKRASSVKSNRDSSRSVRDRHGERRSRSRSRAGDAKGSGGSKGSRDDDAKNRSRSKSRARSKSRDRRKASERGGGGGGGDEYELMEDDDDQKSRRSHRSSRSKSRSRSRSRARSKSRSRRGGEREGREDREDRGGGGGGSDDDED
ncbi:hypothetical protein ACHAWF_005730, partial [Thalassiosira exigua]